MTEHGGKREGSGRPKGSTTISPALRQTFKGHSQTAIGGIIAIAEDKNHQHHFKACQLILERGHGTARPVSDAELVIEKYLSAVGG